MPGDSILVEYIDGSKETIHIDGRAKIENGTITIYDGFVSCGVFIERNIKLVISSFKKCTLV